MELRILSQNTRLASFFVALTFLFLPPAPLLADEITLVADTWCPYNCEPDSAHPGILIEIAEQAFSKHGHTVKYHVLPWTRAKDEARAGRYSGIIGAIKGDAPDFIFPETSLIELSNVFFVKRGSQWKFASMSSLESVSLGVIRGYAYTEEIDAYIEKNKTNQKRVQFSSGDNAIDTLVNKLLAGRVDVILDDHLVVLSTANKLKVASEISNAGMVQAEPGYIAFSPANPRSSEYAKILSDEFRKLEKSGGLKEILSRYGISG